MRESGLIDQPSREVESKEPSFARPAALIVFAKAPIVGRVKTRLSPPLHPEEAARLYQAFLGDALQAFTGTGAFGDDLPVAVRLYLEGPVSGCGEWLPDDVPVFSQRGDGLGARMRRAFVETFATGYERAVIVGTDHPTLPLQFIGEAFRALERLFAAAIGPSEDGGYYLLGLNELYPSLFDMDYSHGKVFADTLARAVEAGARPVILPEWYDVDDVETLRRLIGEWQDGASVPHRTASVLQALLDAHPNEL